MSLANKFAQKAQSLEGSKDIWRPKVGSNFIRVFLFKHKVTAEDIKAGHFPKGMLGSVQVELERAFQRQFSIGGGKLPVLSTKDTIQQYTDLASSASPTDQKMAEAMKPSTVYYINVVDTTAPFEMKLYPAPRTVIKQIFAILSDKEGKGEGHCGAKGTDIKITYASNASPATMYTVALRQGVSATIPSEVEKKVIDLYHPSAIRKLGLVVLATDAVDDAASTDVEETTPDAVDEDASEEVETPKPKAKAKAEPELPKVEEEGEDQLDWLDS